MRPLLFLSLLSVAAAMPAAALADPVTTYNLNATLYNQPTSSVTGTISIDSSTGLFTAIDLTYATDQGTFTFDVVDPPTEHINNFTYAHLFFDENRNASYVEFDESSFVGQTLGTNSVCTLQNICPNYSASNFFEPDGSIPNFESATLTIPTAATPEPSSILLLGTGIFGVAGALRRRVRKS